MMSTFLYLKPEEDTISMAVVDPEFPEVSIPGQGDMVLVSDWPVEAWSKPEKKSFV